MAKKILFISHRFYPDIGGIEVNSEILATAFHETGYKVLLITWTEAIGERTFPFPIVRKPNLIELLKAHNWADLVFENNPSLRLSWPAIFFSSASVIALRTWICRKDGSIGWQDKLKALWLRRSNKVIAVSEAIRKRSWPASIVIGNPYRAQTFKIDQRILKFKDFVFLGRLVSDKGADLAIKAMHELIGETTQKAGGTKLTLTIIGDGVERLALQELAVTLGIHKYITFKGALEGKALVECLNQHRFIIVPSVWDEPFGNVAIEGMACGCIPIVSDGGGLPDAVGKAGLVFESGNHIALKDSMAMLLHDREIEYKLRRAAPAHLANHVPGIVANKYLEIVKEAFENVR